MNSTYKQIGEATETCAFLEWPDGFDKSTLHRVLPDEVEDAEHKAACLDDEQWQRTVNLVDAAPELLEALQNLCDALLPQDMHNGNRDQYNAARAAIAKATAN